MKQSHGGNGRQEMMSLGEEKIQGKWMENKSPMENG